MLNNSTQPSSTQKLLWNISEFTRKETSQSGARKDKPAAQCGYDTDQAMTTPKAGHAEQCSDTSRLRQKPSKPQAKARLKHQSRSKAEAEPNKSKQQFRNIQV